MDEAEHEVYVDMSAADDDAVKELNETKNRLKEMEEEGAALCEMQAKVEKEMDAVQDMLEFDDIEKSDEEL